MHPRTVHRKYIKPVVASCLSAEEKQVILTVFHSLSLLDVAAPVQTAQHPAGAAEAVPGISYYYFTFPFTLEATFTSAKSLLYTPGAKAEGSKLSLLGMRAIRQSAHSFPAYVFDFCLFE